MSGSHVVSLGAYEGEVSSLNPSSSSIMSGNQASHDEIILIDEQVNSQDASAIAPGLPGDEERLSVVAHQAELTSSAFAIENNGHGSRTPVAPDRLLAILNETGMDLKSMNLASANVSGTLLTDWHDKDLSQTRKILLVVSALSIIVGYCSAHIRTFMSRQDTRLASWILTRLACAGAAVGFITSMSMFLDDPLNLWVSLVACAICLYTLLMV
ncbi:uncharacterized protein LOC105628274 [Jatropha curcas]|uniref:uncharacterized protein LOC105628274 n=1 Tax=Jatropha curcas TaxID=180498 RepID=UPI0005FBFA71|nr:uncharacterized protein LOC105628274 [Jatropha curcas]XP_037492956.1 uncharacterized protein LOC105628274 [Jatropha curcas]